MRQAGRMHSHICTLSQQICKQIRKNNDWALKKLPPVALLWKEKLDCFAVIVMNGGFIKGVFCCVALFLFVFNLAMRDSQQHKLTHFHVPLMYLKLKHLQTCGCR